MIQYTDTLDWINSDQLTGGFFAGWPNPPSAETHVRVLRGSAHVWLAVDEQTDQVVGFVTAVSDGVLAAYIPLLEVLPAYQQRGVGVELMRRMLETLSDIYMVDLLCDVELQPYYERLGMRRATGMLVRNYAAQSGKPAPAGYLGKSSSSSGESARGAYCPSAPDDVAAVEPVLPS